MLLETTRDRTAMPAFRLSAYSDTRHFGGNLQAHRHLPSNYLAVNASFQRTNLRNRVAALLFHRVADKTAERVIDITMVLEGKQEDEVPERALCTSRMVNVSMQDVAERCFPEVTNSEEAMAHRSNTGMGMYQEKMNEHAETAKDNLMDRSASSATPVMELATNEVVKILDEVTAPIRHQNSNYGTLLKSLAPVRKLLRDGDIQRVLKATIYDTNETALRLTRTAICRGSVFPIDTRKCRVELHNRQLFQHGSDRRGNQVLYLRNLCRGPWRQDEDATVSAILYPVSYTHLTLPTKA